MKKLVILGICAFAGVNAFAQLSVIKDAEAAVKSGKNFQEVVTIITPAMSDPETANNAAIYFLPGKAAFKTFDDMFKAELVQGELDDNGKKTRGEALLNGYEYYLKALPLDSMPNEKGKIKPKYSKEIVSTITGHHADFDKVAVDMYNIKDYAGAYRAWDAYTAIPRNPTLMGSLSGFFEDSILAAVKFNQALAAYLADQPADALKTFIDAKNLGYSDKTVYDYAIVAATQVGDRAAVEALCMEAMPIYGKEDSNYIGNLINGYLEQKDFDKALEMINKAIDEDPANAQYYVIRGIINDQKGVDSRSDYLKAVELDPNNDMALYQLGLSYAMEADKANEAAPADQNEYMKVKASTIDPLYRQSVDYLEKSWNANNENTDALNLLKNVYYVLGDEAGMKSVDERKLQ